MLCRPVGSAARASYGGLTDEWYPTNKANARAAGLAFGAYHYAYPTLNTTTASILEEADNFVAAMGIHEQFLALMQGKGQVEPDEEVLEDGIAFAGVARFPARIKCALLSWMAWKDATLSAAETNAETNAASAAESNAETNKETK